MKNVFMIFALCVLFAGTASAQGFGVRGGINGACLAGEDYDEFTDTRAGGHIGVSYDISISKRLPFYIETGLYYTFKGGEEEEDRRHGAEWTSTATLSYLEIPVVLSYHIPIGRRKIWTIEPSIGGYYAYGVGGEFKDKSDFENTKVDAFGDKGILNRSDAGFRIGVGAKLKHHLYFGLNYDAGLVNVAKDNNGDYECYTFNCYFTAGYNF